MPVKKIKYLILGLILASVSCTRRTEVKGHVYSKNNIPIPNASIDISEYGSSSYPLDYGFDATKTDANGEYHYTFAAKNTKKRYYRVRCSMSDSGYAEAYIEKGKVNNIDLYLKK